MTHTHHSRGGPHADRARDANEGVNGDGGHRAELSEEAMEVLGDLGFVWPTNDDAGLASQTLSISNCYTPGEVTRRAVHDRRNFVVVQRDTEAGEVDARAIAQQCHSLGAAKVYTYKLPGFVASLGEWCSKSSLATTLEMQHASRYPDFVVFVSEAHRVSPDFSGVEPKPITVALPRVPPLEDVMIPSPLRAWILDIAMRAWIPPEYPAASSIVALSGLIGSRLTIRPKRRDRWLVAPNLYGAAVGPPGALKSPMVEEGLRPLKRLAAEASEDHKSKMSDFETRKLVQAAKQDAAKKRLAAAAKKTTVDEAELDDLAREAVPGVDDVQPKERRYIVNDVTIEKLQVVMAQNPRGLLYFRDELTGLFRTMEKQGHESDRKFFLESWVGLYPYRVERMGREEVLIERACLSIFGTIQPGPLASYLRGSISGEEADGFMPRFQILVYPDPYPEFAYIDQAPNGQAKDRAVPGV